MTGFLIGLPLGAVIALVGLQAWDTPTRERLRLLLAHAEQILDAATQILATVPSKSAARTDGSNDTPAAQYARLEAAEIARWEADGGTPTEPMRLDVAGGMRVGTETVQGRQGRHRAA